MSNPPPDVLSERFHALVEFLVDASNTEGGFVDADLTYRWTTDTLLGASADTLRGQSNDEVFTADTAEVVTELQQQALTTGERVEQTVNLIHSEAPARYRFVASPVPASTDSPSGVIFAAVDLSDQFQYLERTTDAVFTVDPDWRITFWSEQMADRTGMAAEDVVGENYWDLLGDLIPAGLEERYRRVMQTGESEEFEIYLPEPFDYWAEARVFADEAGLSIYSREISARKRHEQQLETQRDAFQILNQLLRHDIRNDLQAAMGYLTLLTDQLDEDGSDHAKTVRSSLEHATELTVTARQMAETISQDTGELEPLRLDRALEEEINTVRDAYPDAVVLTEGAFPATTVLADALLGSVFRNLLKNAIQHNDTEPPEVTVSLSQSDTTATVTIADNGPGIPAEVRDTLFTRGAKGASSTGTGIGLYLVATLVEHYDGEITVGENDPRGTQISVSLPRAD